MSNEKKYRVSPPIQSAQGQFGGPLEKTEQEIRVFAIEIMVDRELDGVWGEKIQKDNINEVISWLTQSGYSITEI